MRFHKIDGDDEESKYALKLCDCVDFHLSDSLRNLIAVHRAGERVVIGVQFNVDMCVFDCAWNEDTSRWTLVHSRVLPGFGLIASSRKNKKRVLINASDCDAGGVVSVVDYRRRCALYRAPRSTDETFSCMDSVELDATDERILGENALSDQLVLLTDRHVVMLPIV